MRACGKKWIKSTELMLSVYPASSADFGIMCRRCKCRHLGTAVNSLSSEA